MKKEQKWNTILNQYLREKKFYCFFELKATEMDSFPLNKIRRVQDEGLPALEKNGLVWKWSDEISRPKPADGVSIPPLPSYLIIKFADAFYFIRYENVVKFRDEGIISITRSMAEKLAEKIIKLN